MNIIISMKVGVNSNVGARYVVTGHSLFLFEYTVRVSKCVSNSELDYLWELLISMRTVTSGLFSSYRECSLFRSVECFVGSGLYT